MKPLYIGCAGWSIPRAEAGHFPEAGSHLHRYAARLPAVEINSSFYRPHRQATYARWADTVPEGFRFAVKMPKAITHERRLIEAVEPLQQFLEEISGLRDRLGVVLMQLPPSLRFDVVVAAEFFTTLRDRFDGNLACEPRHASWFTDGSTALLREMRIARVAADPAPVPAAAIPGGWPGLVYRRLHGSPKMYYSNYSEPFLAQLAGRLTAEANRAPAWGIFDNTADGFAVANARSLLALGSSETRSVQNAPHFRQNSFGTSTA